MKVDGGIGDMRGGSEGGYLSGAGASAKELEDQGYDGIWTAETTHDPFFPLLLAAADDRAGRARHRASRWRSPATR